MKKKISLSLQILMILSAFMIAVLFLIYSLQTFFLEDFYKQHKLNTLKEASGYLIEGIEEGKLQERIDSLSLSNEVCVRIVEGENGVIVSDPGNGCALRRLDDYQIDAIAREVSKEKDGKLFDNYTYSSVDSGRQDLYIYGQLTYYRNMPVLVLVSAVISPLAATISTIRSQYILIVLSVVVMTFLLAFLLSRIILKPVKQIEEESRNLSVSAYDPKRVKTRSRELSSLNDTLSKANEEIRKADRAKRELLGNVSHDLRTPLTMIEGYGEMIRDLPEENNEENINVIIDEAKRLSALVDDLLTLSKAQSEGISIKEEEVSLSSLLSSVYHQNEKYFERSKADFELKIEYDATVLTDPKRLEQVLYNFLSNAYNYNDKENKKILLGCRKEREAVRIYVYDNGEGITEEDKEMIFKRYYRAGDTHKRAPMGSGIGLSLAASILDACGYHYGVDSKEKEYSIFYFDIPDDRIVL